MRRSDRRLNFSERVWKERMERIMNEENEWDQNVQADLVEGLVERISREEVVKALGKMKAGKAAGPSVLSVEMIAASGEINFHGERGVKFLEHAMKIVEKVLQRRMRHMVKVDEMQFGFMPGKGTIDAVFILRRLQEEYLDKEKKLYMCFVDLK